MPEIDDFAMPALTLLGPACVKAIEHSPMPSLAAGPRGAELVKLLREDPSSQWSQIPASNHPLCLSGLWLLAGELDRSHTISQDLPAAEGSFWHGIMHRREADFSNAKYWFRRVGSHPVSDRLAEMASDVYDDPCSFVDACSHADDAHRPPLEQVQWL